MGLYTQICRNEKQTQLLSTYSVLLEGEVHSHKNRNETTVYWTHMWFSYLKCYIMLKGGSAIVNNILSSQLDSIKEIKAKPQPKQCFLIESNLYT